MSGSLPPDVYLRARIGSRPTERLLLFAPGSTVRIYVDVLLRLTGALYANSSGWAAIYLGPTSGTDDNLAQPLDVAQAQPGTLSIDVPALIPGYYRVSFSIQYPIRQSGRIEFLVPADGGAPALTSQEWSDVQGVAAAVAASAAGTILNDKTNLGNALAGVEVAGSLRVPDPAADLDAANRRSVRGEFLRRPENDPTATAYIDIREQTFDRSSLVYWGIKADGRDDTGPLSDALNNNSVPLTYPDSAQPVEVRASNVDVSADNAALIGRGRGRSILRCQEYGHPTLLLRGERARVIGLRGVQPAAFGAPIPAGSPTLPGDANFSSACMLAVMGPGGAEIHDIEAEGFPTVVRLRAPDNYGPQARANRIYNINSRTHWCVVLATGQLAAQICGISGEDTRGGYGSGVNGAPPHLIYFAGAANDEEEIVEGAGYTINELVQIWSITSFDNPLSSAVKLRNVRGGTLSSVISRRAARGLDLGYCRDLVVSDVLDDDMYDGVGLDGQPLNDPNLAALSLAYCQRIAVRGYATRVRADGQQRRPRVVLLRNCKDVTVVPVGGTGVLNTAAGSSTSAYQLTDSQDCEIHVRARQEGDVDVALVRQLGATSRGNRIYVQRATSTVPDAARLVRLDAGADTYIEIADNALTGITRGPNTIVDNATGTRVLWRDDATEAAFAYASEVVGNRTLGGESLDDARRGLRFDGRANPIRFNFFGPRSIALVSDGVQGRALIRSA